VVHQPDDTDRRPSPEVCQSDQSYRILFDSIDEGFCVLEVLFDGAKNAIDCLFLEVNRAFEKQTGMPNPVGKRASELDSQIDPHWLWVYGRVALTGEPERFQYPVASLDRHFDVYAFRVGTPDQRRVAVLFNDITERKRTEAERAEIIRELRAAREQLTAELLERSKAERALEDANERLLEADRRKDQFLAILSHELRNPLTPIRNSVHVLSLAVPGGEQVRRAQAVIERQVGHMVRLIDDLLDVTRLRGGQVQLRREPVDVNEVVQRATEDHRVAFLEKGVELEAALVPVKLSVQGDRTRLAQVMGNLLQNALKFTPRGGKTNVSVGADAERRQAVIRVEDTGRGIEPDVLPRLFEPFAQADESLDRSMGGLGLGLSVVKGLVEMHGGSVEAASDGNDQGATFTVTLPLGNAGRAEATPGGALQGAHPRRVLVVDDSVDAADSLRAALELNGHQVEVAHGGPEGIRKARAFGPDVVLCDIGLPDMDGYEVARKLRTDPDFTHVTLVALTGYAGSKDVARAKEAGFDAHVAKPPSLEALERLLSLG
jgi:signal transduction histidine kinase